eukprot:6479572-Amphidinium_carterae.1
MTSRRTPRRSCEAQEDTFVCWKVKNSKEPSVLWCYGGDYVDRAPYVRAAMLDVIKKVCGMHDEQMYQLMRMLPYGQLSLLQSDLDFSYKLTTRIYAELCAKRNWPLLLSADITVTEWIYFLLRD